MEIITRLLPETDEIPNNSLQVLLYRSAVSPPDAESASTFERLFGDNGWGGSWRNGVYGFHHYHSTAHEVLGVYRGSATLQLGGEPGFTTTVTPGDVVLIPAGVGHKNVESTSNLGVVGAYPLGQHADLCRGRAERPAADGRIVHVPLPERDPVFGMIGGLMEHWISDRLE